MELGQVTVPNANGARRELRSSHFHLSHSVHIVSKTAWAWRAGLTFDAVLYFRFTRGHSLRSASTPVGDVT